MPYRGVYCHWGVALFVEGYPKKAFSFFHCLKLSIFRGKLRTNEFQRYKLDRLHTPMHEQISSQTKKPAEAVFLWR
jgi:hypothetical protein